MEVKALLIENQHDLTGDRIFLINNAGFANRGHDIFDADQEKIRRDLPALSFAHVKVTYL